MRIEDKFRIFQIYNKTSKVEKVDKKIVSQKADKVEISQEAKDFQAILNAIKNTPDIRQDKVDEIKKKIESNTYNVSSNDIIEKLISDYKNSK
ncbi:flagellar biosynthesis anti-sigma factor FlgM [Caldicellulosiruptoraceae bacterium PP1]